MINEKLERKLRFLIRTLPVVFLLHNIEELMTMEQWWSAYSGFNMPSVTTNQFAIAVGIFSALGFIIAYGRRLYKSEHTYYYFIAGFSGMLLLNVFIPHLIGAIYLGTYTPGLITSVLLNLPLSLSIFKLLRELKILNIKQVVLATVIGGITGAILAFLLLKVGGIFI